MKTRDPLTGNAYITELTMYVRYHGYTYEQAEEVLSYQTYAERDEACEKINQENRRMKCQ